ncbi:MAG: SAP domain-containing protein [Actinomycetota bacterium]|nr:SAP domain-containing protein [Actinomycetota bacterium]
MTSTTERHSAAASQATGTAEKIADFWTQGARTLSNRMLPGRPKVDLVPVVERYFEFVQRTVDMSRDLTIKWVETAGMVSGVVREQAESARDLVHEQADKAEQAVREQADKAEQAQQELAREARRAEREQARQAHAKARQPYEGLTKAELSDLLSQRDLPKTGNVDELVERLVEADSK